MRRAICLFISFGFILSSASASTEAPGDVAAAAAAAYERGLQAQGQAPEAAREAFAESARLYQDLTAQGYGSSHLYFNLGLAQMQSGDLGPAVLNLRRAERLNPNDESIRLALSQARQQSGSPDVDSVAGFNVARWPAPSLEVWIGIPLAIAGAALLIIFRRHRRIQGFAALGLLAGFVLAGDAVWRLQVDAMFPVGVVSSGGTILREGDGESYRPVSSDPLRAGAEFRVVAHRDGWVRVKMRDGSRGWLQRDQVIVDQ